MIMSGDWKDRIAECKRIMLARGYLNLCAVMRQQFAAQSSGKDPELVKASDAAYANCSVKARETKLGVFRCAVVLKDKIKASTIPFLSADRTKDDPNRKNRPMFQSPDRQR